ncbi:MAG: flavin reductase family protein [Candidatus Margulisbacteria bacterium]|jgi:flavin reductase (DIM6/NTAB) family NADH-FMN oxidoreductase RutF|nr:flavin reductase family protein [Candidatus Margulisiibacteriota bacterium]
MRGAKNTLRKFPLHRAFTFMEEGPVVLLSTFYQGRNNIMTTSCTMSMDFSPLVGVMLGPWDCSYRALLQTKECVFAIPGADLLEKTVAIGNCSGDEVDKFAEFKLTPRPATKVKAPLIGECLKNLECKLLKKLNINGGELFVLQGVAAWHNPARREQRAFHAKGDGTFFIDGRQIDLRKKMTRWQDCI